MCGNSVGFAVAMREETTRSRASSEEAGDTIAATMTKRVRVLVRYVQERPARLCRVSSKFSDRNRIYPFFFLHMQKMRLLLEKFTVGQI